MSNVNSMIISKNDTSTNCSSPTTSTSCCSTTMVTRPSGTSSSGQSRLFTLVPGSKLNGEHGYIIVYLQDFQSRQICNDNLQTLTWHDKGGSPKGSCTQASWRHTTMSSCGTRTSASRISLRKRMIHQVLFCSLPWTYESDQGQVVVAGTSTLWRSMG
jgi:hypothetical protein